MKNPGLGLKDDRYTNMMALCHEHHMFITAVGGGQETWAKKFFWGCDYSQVVAFVAMQREWEEERGWARRIEDISLDSVDSDDAFAVLLAYTQRDVFKGTEFGGEDG